MTLHKKWLAAALAAGLAQPALADEDLRIKSHIDEDVTVRQNTGLNKLRTLIQTDIDKAVPDRGGLFSSVSLHATLRASYDAVYEANSREYGKKAGGPVSFTNNITATPLGAASPHGGGAGTTLLGLLGFPPTGFPDAYPASNPNDGMMPLAGWRDGHTAGGVSFGVPVRPCDVDSRGCIDDYMDADKLELASPEFNDRLDFIRELYVDADMPLAGNTLHLRVGRQQIVWGRTDLFRVLDVINPVDYSRNNIYDELQDIRIPMAMARLDYRMGARGPFDDINAQFVWNFEKFRPNKLGQGGATNVALDAGSFFRGMKNCWDNGCTVANFAAGGLATNFPAHSIGIRQANLPDWTLGNTTYGGKIEGELKGVGFSVNALRTFSQMPVLRGGVPADNPFTPGVENQSYPYLIAFDIDFPRITVVGGSLDFAIDPIETAFRVETALSWGENFQNTAQPELYSKHRVLRYVIGADRSTYIPYITGNHLFLVSGQLFGQHIFNHELQDLPTGKIGVPDWEDNWIATLLIKGWYLGDTVSPQVVLARDIKARANVVEPSVEYIMSSNWLFKLGASVKFGNYRHNFDDNRSAAPFPPFTGPAAASSTGALAGLEPLGRFRTGVIGMAHDETQLFARAVYRF